MSADAAVNNFCIDYLFLSADIRIFGIKSHYFGILSRIYHTCNFVSHFPLSSFIDLSARAFQLRHFLHSFLSLPRRVLVRCVDRVDK